MAAAASSAAATKSVGFGGNAPVEVGSGSIVLSGKLKAKHAGESEAFDETYDWTEFMGRHFYPRVLNATLHPVVRTLFGMPTESILLRYCHMRPHVNRDKLREMLHYRPKHFRWAGADTFCTTTADGKRSVVVIETNSCASGQKHMPSLNDDDEYSGYKRLVGSSFVDLIGPGGEHGGDGGSGISAEDAIPDGVLAVIYDKNKPEASGYAASIASLTGEATYLVEFYLTDPDPPVRWSDDGVMSIRIRTSLATAHGHAGRGTPADKETHPDFLWLQVRACFRYVTQRPWTRFPIITKTRVLNPIICCLAGGRNKLMAAKAYEFLNADMTTAGAGLHINTPETIRDVSKREVPLYVKYFGGHAVVKVPYGNAGQGVYTILSKEELDAFMAEEHHYDRFIVQSLIGSSKWGSITGAGSERYYHVGTLPTAKGKIYVCDVRCMVNWTATGWRPCCMYARRAHTPLPEECPAPGESWACLGTNLSKLKTDLEWTTETERLMLMDTKDFNKLGVGVDDLIDAFVQTVLAAVAIDKMCARLVKGRTFDYELFKSLNDDEALLAELVPGAEDRQPPPRQLPAAALAAAAEASAAAATFLTAGTSDFASSEVETA